MRTFILPPSAFSLIICASIYTSFMPNGMYFSASNWSADLNSSGLILGNRTCLTTTDWPDTDITAFCILVSDFAIERFNAATRDSFERSPSNCSTEKCSTCILPVFCFETTTDFTEDVPISSAALLLDAPKLRNGILISLAIGNQFIFFKQ